MEIKMVAVVGAGVMGSDVAFDFSAAGFQVILKDIHQGILEKAEKKVKQTFKMVKMASREFKDISLDEIQSRISFQIDNTNLDDVDLVLENVPECLETKETVFRELEGLCKQGTIFASNTSCISITKLSSFLSDPSRMVGAHFMNPVPLKRIVEVVKGVHTSEETLDSLELALKKMKKRAIVVNDYPGFVANRLSHLFMNEAAFLVQDGVADAKQVDLLFKQGYGHAMGPLETADLIGLDTVVNSLNVLYESYQDSKFRCCPLLKRMVDAGHLGRKSGRGFYGY